MYYFFWSLIPVLILAAPVMAEMKIHRTYVEYDYLNVIVEYTNKTSKTFRQVTIKCEAIDSAGKIINMNTRSFFKHEHGPIMPGFSGSVKVPISLHGINAKSASCIEITM